MSYKKIIRNLYDVQHPPRPHDSNNHNQDMIDFHLTSQHMQNANLHDWGIARGLEVSGKIGSKEIVVYPGVAIDIEGKLISLATNGHGDIGPNPPGQQHHPVPLPVRLSTEGIAKHHVYVTIRYSEMKQNNAGVGGLMEQVPWLRLQPVSGPSPNVYVHDGKTIILAVAYIDTNQKLETLSYEDNNVQYRRQVIGQSIEELRIQRSVKAGDRVKEKDSAILGPASGGGLEIRDAERIVVRDSSEKEVLNFDSDAALLNLGTKGNEGDLIINDQTGNESARIDGNTGKLNIKIIDPYGDSLDIDARYLRIHGWDLCLDGRSGNNKRALVDLNNKLVINYNNDYANGVETHGDFKVDGRLKVNVDGIDRILGGNPARYVKYARMYAYGNGPRTVTYDVDLVSSRRFFAFTAIVGVDPLGDFDKYDAHAAEVYQVDGTSTYKWWHDGRHFGSPGSDANFHTPVYQGIGRIITFRVRTFDNAGFHAIGIVFHE